MDLSKKILLASFVSAAFLTIGLSCSVEDRDIEAKNTFVCQKNDDCLNGSRCVMYSATEGRCVREDQVDHCHDNDKDGYMKAESEEYVNECAFSETYPQDPDDTDPTVHPFAAEYCDGKDNDGDGCVDGTCPEGADCSKDKTLCKQFVQPCWGTGDVSDYDESVCSAAKIGVLACVDGKLVHAKPSGNGYEPDGGACPRSTDDIVGYDEDEKTEAYMCDGIDNNCNGMIDENCTKCEVGANKYCFFSSSWYEGKAVSSESDEMYVDALTACGGSKPCECIGIMECKDINGNTIINGDPICVTSAGPVTNAAGKGWACLKEAGSEN